MRKLLLAVQFGSLHAD